MNIAATLKALSTLIPMVTTILGAIKRLDITRESKFETALAYVGAILDDSFDDVPEWSDLGEEKRDIIVAGLIELVLFLRKTGKSKALKKALKQLRKA